MEPGRFSSETSAAHAQRIAQCSQNPVGREFEQGSKFFPYTLLRFGTLLEAFGTQLEQGSKSKQSNTINKKRDTSWNPVGRELEQGSKFFPYTLLRFGTRLHEQGVGTL